MPAFEPAVSTIDMQLAEIAGIVQALIFMQEEADDAKRDELRNSTVTLLYVITDKVKAANAGVTVVSRFRETASTH